MINVDNDIISHMIIMLAQLNKTFETGIAGPYLAGGGATAVEKVPFLRAGALFPMPNHHHHGALLKLGVPPPPSNFRLRTVMHR